MALLTAFKISTAPGAFVGMAMAHNALVDYVATISGENGVKVTISDGRILITMDPATMPKGQKGDPGTPGTSPPATSDLLRGDGSGGFTTAALGSGMAFGTSAELRTAAGTDGAILKNDGSNGFGSVTIGAGLNYTTGTLRTSTGTTSSILRDDGANGFAFVTIGSGLTYAGGSLSANVSANTGTTTAILRGNGTGGFSDVTIGAGLAFAGGTLSANVVANTGTTQNIVAGNGAGGFAIVSTGPSLTYDASSHVIDTIQDLRTTANVQHAGMMLDNINVGRGSNWMNVAFGDITHPMGIRELAYANLANATIEQFTICNNGTPENRWWPTWSTAPASPIPKLLTVASADY